MSDSNNGGCGCGLLLISAFIAIGFGWPIIGGTIYVAGAIIGWLIAAVLAVLPWVLGIAAVLWLISAFTSSE